ncbi:MAG: hypothetical protein LBD75_08080 [Candidatus Peribacteria bacterium]|jgi:hypothetical protein|nr:hypothetical protein [Candidatus Peribacteria bacterium]
MLKGLDWKHIKQQAHQNYEEMLRSLLGILLQQGYVIDTLINEVDKIFEQLKVVELRKA